VPAVAAKRRRLVLFIFNRSKGYLDGLFSHQQETNKLEFYVRRGVFMELELKFIDTIRTGHGEGNLLCNN